MLDLFIDSTTTPFIQEDELAKTSRKHAYASTYYNNNNNNNNANPYATRQCHQPVNGSSSSASSSLIIAHSPNANIDQHYFNYDDYDECQENTQADTVSIAHSGAEQQAIAAVVASSPADVSSIVVSRSPSPASDSSAATYFSSYCHVEDDELLRFNMLERQHCTVFTRESMWPIWSWGVRHRPVWTGRHLHWKRLTHHRRRSHQRTNKRQLHQH